MEANLIFEKPQDRIGWVILGITIALLALWIPVVIDKVIDFRQFRTGILRQPLPDVLGHLLVWALPPLEFATAVLLLVGGRLHHWGLWLSFGLMLAFTGYVAVALAGAWEKLPCGCGSVISGLTWRQHFWFNLFFLALSGAGIHLMHQQRSRGTRGAADEGLSAKRPDINQ
ncbi:MauE/DoxX family redox-associated membrane protein [Parapedobacter sp. DT-150]|uniref:MauE/DoxX family redox-associated membrane protein n=1 Tax=Parapedobacter sp. DT-150 TaxID=3396162 RepID=UPI003F1E45B6